MLGFQRTVTTDLLATIALGKNHVDWDTKDRGQVHFLTAVSEPDHDSRI